MKRRVHTSDWLALEAIEQAWSMQFGGFWRQEKVSIIYVPPEPRVPLQYCGSLLSGSRALK